VTTPRFAPKPLERRLLRRPGGRTLRGAAVGSGPGGGRRALAALLQSGLPPGLRRVPHQHLLTRRLERATALLRATDWSVARVCYAVGWSSLGSFTTSFRRMHGQTPTRYRAASSPAAVQLRIPRCVAIAYGRPHNRTFREDGVRPVP